MSNQDYIAGILKKLQSLNLGNSPTITNEITEVWAECLEDIKPEIIALGCKHVLKNGTTSGFFPSAPEFRKICLQFGEDAPQSRLDKAWRTFKNFVPSLHGVAADKQKQTLEADSALRRCIEAFHSDWSNAVTESSSYWYKIFSENYLNASTGQVFEEGRKRLEERKNALTLKRKNALTLITTDDFGVVVS